MTGQPPDRSLRRFIALSRQILHLASRGTSRGEFLRDLSKLVLDFSGCEAIELRLRGSIDYRWRAEGGAHPSFTYEPSSAATSDHPLRVNETRSWDLAQVVRHELREFVSPAAPCFTPHGSFWTDELVDTLGRHAAGSDAAPRLVARTVSLAVIPFAVDVNSYGMLRLESARRRAFTLDVIESYEAVGETLGLAIAERRAQAALRERVKELACLYGIARVVEQSTMSVESALQRIVSLLPPAWRFPEIAAARISLDGIVCETGDIERVRSRQVAAIVVNGERRGQVEVGYVDEVEQAVNGPFLEEEEHLLAGVAREIGEFMERRQAAADRSRMEAQLRHADRLATIGQLAAGVAHEINEPLGSILGFAQLAQKSPGLTGPLRQDLERIVAACLQARETVNKLKLFARQAPVQKVPVSVARVVDEALGLVEARCASEDIELERRREAEVVDIAADPVQLKQVVVNLVVNGIQAMPEGGTLTIRTGSDRASAFIEVGDTGVGMSEETMDQIFNPFFTTKDVGEGTGLGLSLVHGIVTAHGGVIEVNSEAGKGSTFTVRLPVQPELGDRDRSESR